MKQTLQIGLFSLRDVSRNMWLIVYTAFFALLTFGLFQFQGHSEKVVVSITSICLILIPLVSALFGTMHFYNMREFTELMLTQPVKRKSVYTGMYLGLTSALIGGFLIGILLPFIIFGRKASGGFESLLTLMIIGSVLTLVFVAISFFVAASFDDRGKGIAVIISFWLITALLYDGLVLFIATAFSDYPLEKPLLALSLANPIDLARVLLLVKSDIAALMGYTGAVFNRFFGTYLGVSLASISLLIWFAAPLGLGIHRFQKKDF
jgi:Cu-processing system permease protein